MVKGVSKQAVIVRPPADSGFEQAIFILSPDGEGQRVSSPEELIKTADAIVSQASVPGFRLKRRGSAVYCLLSFAAGAAAAALAFYFLPIL